MIKTKEITNVPVRPQEKPDLGINDIRPHFCRKAVDGNSLAYSQIQSYRDAPTKEKVDRLHYLAGTSNSIPLTGCAFSALGELALVDNRDAQKALRRLALPHDGDRDFKARFWKIALEDPSSVGSCLRFLSGREPGYLSLAVRENPSLGKELVDSGIHLISLATRSMVMGALVRAPFSQPQEFQFEALRRLDSIHSGPEGARQLFQIATSPYGQVHESLASCALGYLCKSIYRTGAEEVIPSKCMSNYDYEIGKQFIEALKSNHMVEPLLKIVLDKEQPLRARHDAEDAIFASISELSKNGVRNAAGSDVFLKVLARLAKFSDFSDTSYRATKALGESCLDTKQALDVAQRICRDTSENGPFAFKGAVEAMGEMLKTAEPFERQKIVKFLREARSGVWPSEQAAKTLWSCGGVMEKITAPLDFISKWKKILFTS